MYQLWSGWPHAGNADSVKDFSQERERVKQDNGEMEEEQGHGEAGQDQGGREQGDGDHHEGLRRKSGGGGRDLL